MCGVMTQDTLVETFKSLPLTRLRLRIDVHDVNPLRESSYSRFIRIMAGFPQPPASQPLPPCVAEASAACVSVPAIMRALCAAVPRVQTLGLSFLALDAACHASLATGFARGGALQQAPARG